MLRQYFWVVLEWCEGIGFVLLLLSRVFNELHKTVGSASKLVDGVKELAKKLLPPKP